MTFYKETDRYSSISTGGRDECGTHLQNISHVLRKKYGEKNEMHPDFSGPRKNRYSVGNLTVILSCRSVKRNDTAPNERREYQLGEYEQLTVIYNDARLRKQRELEWNKLEKQILDRKTRNIDSSKFKSVA